MNAPSPVVSDSGFARFRASLNTGDRASIGGMYGFIVFLHLIGFGVLLAFVVPYYCFVARKAVRASRAYLTRRLGPARWPRSLLRTYRHFYEFGQVLVDRFLFYLRGAGQFDREARIAQGTRRAHGSLVSRFAHPGDEDVDSSLHFWFSGFLERKDQAVFTDSEADALGRRPAEQFDEAVVAAAAAHGVLRA